MRLSSGAASRRFTRRRRRRPAAMPSFTPNKSSVPTRAATLRSCGRNREGRIRMKSEAVNYSVDGASHQGQLIYDESKPGQPLLMVAPNWRGVTADNIAIGHKHAGDGYVVFLPDMFGV